jgi:hypothetical protein
MGVVPRLTETACVAWRAAPQIVFRTKMQTHDFNTPYQLGTNCT